MHAALRSRYRLAALAASGLLAGCASYRARPLDDDAHRREWAARSADAPTVREFADRLRTPNAPADAFSAADGLSRGEAEAVALFYNADLRVARLRAGVARASAATAGLWEDPELGFDGARILAGVDEPWIAGATLGITIPISGRLEAERSLADAEAGVALARTAEQEWAVRHRLRIEWSEWSSLELKIEELRSFVAEVERIAGVAEHLQGAGEMSRTEARLFRLELLSRRNDLHALEAAAAEARLSLVVLMGLVPDAPVRLAPGLDHPDETPGAGPSDHPAIAARRAAYAAAEQSLRHEIRKQYPDITIGPGGGVEDGDPRFLLGVSLPLPLWNRNQRGVATAAAEREVARAEYEAEVERREGAIAGARVRLESARNRRRELEEVLGPLVDAQQTDLEHIAQAGDFDALLTLESLVRRHETKVRIIDAQREESLAAWGLADLLGPGRSPAAKTGSTQPNEEIHP